MPENIFKIYPPKKDPSKDGRRGSGLWSEDTPNDRFEHVKRILDIYYSDDIFFDDLDLTWFLKNAVIGNIYFSEEVVRGIEIRNYWPNISLNIRNTIINPILEGKTYRNNKFDESLLQVRKWLGKQYYKDGVSPLRFEHVIPAKIYLEELKELYKRTNSFTDNNSTYLFEDYRKKIAVCVITKDEDDNLNNAGLRENMPNNWTWNDNLFARYESVDIKVHNIP